MSISPQSLARTRDKRSHKVPARFNDTVYNEVHYTEATQVLRASTRSRPSSVGVKRELEDEEPEEGEEVLRAIKASSSRSSSHSKKQTKPANNEPTIVSAPITPTTVTEVATTTTTITNSTTTTTATTTSDAANATSAIMPARPLAEQIPNSTSTPPPSATPSPVSAAAPKPATNPKKRSSSSSSKKKSNGVSLIFKQPPTSVGKKLVQESASVKPKLSATILGGATNFTIRHNNSNQFIASQPNATPVGVMSGGAPPQPPPPNFVSPGPRHFSGLTPTNQQYGTRILINEPIYLPRSVGPIAPLTTSLAQIANQARRPPFVSKRTEAFLIYQDERKLNHIASTHSALIKIAQNLGVTDRLSLRAVNRTWRSIVDCDLVWKKVLLTSEDERVNLRNLAQQMTQKFRTNEIYFDQFQEPNSGQSFAGNLLGKDNSVKRIRFRTTTDKQHSIAYSMLVALRDRVEYLYKTGEPQGCSPLFCEWHVKVGVDALGIATVALLVDSLDGETHEELIERGHLEETSDMGFGKFITIEFHDLKDEIFGPKPETKSSCWQELKSSTGRVYYHNSRTGVSQWDKPPDMRQQSSDDEPRQPTQQTAASPKSDLKHEESQDLRRPSSEQSNRNRGLTLELRAI